MERRILRLKEAQAFLTTIHEELVASIRNGFGDWLRIREFTSTLGGGPVIHQSRTKACIIHDHIIKYIKTAFNGKEGIELGDYKGVFGINLSDELFIRFKKMDKEYIVSNYETAQHTQYMKQGQILGFPEKPTLLFAGYIPDKSWSAITGIYVACWIGNTLEWVDEAGKYSTEQIIIEFPQESKEVVKEIERRIKLKGGQKGDTKTATDNG